IWLFLAVILKRPEFLFPYTLSFAANLSIIGIARLRFDYPEMSAARLLAICISRAWLSLFLPYLLIVGISSNTVLACLVALPAVALAGISFYYTQPGIYDCPTDTPRWFRQAANAALGSCVGFIPLTLH